jgi:hypothetical protein
MVFEEMQQHKLRMKTVKSVVDHSPPWAYTPNPVDDRSGGGKSAMAKKLRGDVAATREISSSAAVVMNASAASRPQSAARIGRPGSALSTRHPGGRPTSAASRRLVEPAPPSFDVASLNESDREAYSAMLRLLTRLSNDESRAALEQLYRESEDRKLLASYTGVFPKLENEQPTACAQP